MIYDYLPIINNFRKKDGQRRNNGYNDNYGGRKRIFLFKKNKRLNYGQAK